MAFTGVATIKQIADDIVRITGLSLAHGASGTISLSGGAGAVLLPAAFQPEPYGYEGATVSLQDSIDVTTTPATAVATAIPIQVAKSGTTLEDFLVTLTNNHGATDSPGLEIYVKFHS